MCHVSRSPPPSSIIVIIIIITTIITVLRWCLLSNTVPNCWSSLFTESTDDFTVPRCNRQSHFFPVFVSVILMGEMFSLFFVCLSVCLVRIFCKTAERISLKFCTGTEVCHEQCVSHFSSDRPRVPQGSRKCAMGSGIVSVLHWPTYYYFVVYLCCPLIETTLVS